MEKIIGEIGAGSSAVTRSGNPTHGARKWAASWRARWAVRLGTLRVRETIPGRNAIECELLFSCRFDLQKLDRRSVDFRFVALKK